MAKLNADINALLKSPDVAETLAKQGLQATGGTPDDLAQLTRTDLERWAASCARRRSSRTKPELPEGVGYALSEPATTCATDAVKGGSAGSGVGSAASAENGRATLRAIAAATARRDRR